MTELNAKGVDDVYIEYYNTGKHDLAQVYLKSEVDKVIAEKDKEIAGLKAKLEDVQASAYAESVDAGMENHKLKRAARTLRKKMNHQKYKRCLAMAEICQYRSEMVFTSSKKMGFLMKWQKRWLGLAEKFKEAK